MAGRPDRHRDRRGRGTAAAGPPRPAATPSATCWRSPWPRSPMRSPRPPTWSSRRPRRSRWRSCAAFADLVTDADGPGAAALIRPAEEDMFRLGSRRADRRRTVREFTAAPVTAAAVRRAIAAAITAPAPHHSQPWRFAVVESAPARTRLLDDMLAAWRPTCAATASRAEQIARRVRRGDVLRRAPLLDRAVPGGRRGARVPGRAARTPPSGRCSWSRWAPPWRTCWWPWPWTASARAGCRARCSAGRRRRARSACRPTGSRWGRSGWATRRRPAPARPDRDPDQFTRWR